ncbi:MAG: hypothetical protein AAF890_06210, partial [Pseudomonadota bacterium]
MTHRTAFGNFLKKWTSDNMFEKEFDTDSLAKYDEKSFFELYNSSQNQNLLDFLEGRVRFELLNIIRKLDRKGEIFIEVRKKS